MTLVEFNNSSKKVQYRNLSPCTYKRQMTLSNNNNGQQETDKEDIIYTKQKESPTAVEIILAWKFFNNCINSARSTQQTSSRESKVCLPEPLRPVIQTTQPFCLSSFWRSVLPTGQSCQKIFDDFGTVDDIFKTFPSTTSVQLYHSENNNIGFILVKQMKKQATSWPID